MQSSASLDRYIQQVRAIPKLSREDEHQLALRAREGDQDAADRWSKPTCDMSSPSGFSIDATA